MKNFRELNDDILKEWLEFREENILCYLNEEDKKHEYAWNHRGTEVDIVVRPWVVDHV